VLTSHQKNCSRPPTELMGCLSLRQTLFVTPADRLDAAFFTRVDSSVKVIATHSAGYDHIDLSAANRTKDRDSQSPCTIDRCGSRPHLLLLLGASRRAYEAQRLVRNGNWNPSDLTLLLGWQLTGQILGIYGMGHIGQAVAERARGFGMKIHYHDRHRLSPEIEKDRYSATTSMICSESAHF
jgi:lactate dehydrogenase-like 2-hydroxyacid dehydrogenase